MAWTQKDLDNLKTKGLKIQEQIKPQKKIKIEKVSIEKQTIQLVLEQFKNKNLITDFVTELKFDEKRRFRFDWAIPELKLAIEYEGIFSKKSRHTTVSGYSTDLEKYNLATTQGWIVLRYTAANYLNFEQDFTKLRCNKKQRVFKKH